MSVPYSKDISEERAKSLALQMTLEWLEHPDFKPRVKLETFMQSVTIGRTLLEIAKETNYNTYNPTYYAAMQRWCAARDSASWNEWLVIGNRAVGRNRQKDYDRHEVALAHRRLLMRRDHHLETRDECITGGPQKTNTTMVCLQNNLWRDLLNDITAQALTGNTCEEIADACDLPDRAARCFWRWLVRNGWKTKRLRHPDGSRSYVIVQKEVG